MNNYRFDRITTQGLIRDIVGFRGGPEAGDPFPEFDLLTTEGKRVRDDDFIGLRPLLITVGSLTCPMTASAAPALRRLHEDFGRQVSFLTVYVREAHPGDNIGQARDRDEKLNYAHVLQQRDGLLWPVAADSVEGDLHRQLGSRPSAAFLVDREGKIIFRALWAGDDAGLRRALRQLIEGKKIEQSESRRRLLSILGGIGCMSETLADAGPEARRQLMRKAPPYYALGRIAGIFRPLPPIARGIVAVSVSAAAVYLLLSLGRKRRE